MKVLDSIHRSGLFWKVLLPGIGTIVATALVMSADSLSWSLRTLLLSLVIAAAMLHAFWITWRVTGAADSLCAAIQRMGTDQNDEHGSGSLPIEAAPLVQAAADLEHRLQCRIEKLHQDKTDFANTTALLEAVLETMVEGVVVLDSDQRILFTNPASHPLLDIQSKDVTGRPLWEIARLSPVAKAVESVLLDKQRQAFEFEIPRTKLIVAATVTALPREPLSGVMLVLHDVTELRRLENMRRDFVSNVSHELKTPLTSIQAYADTLLEDDESDPQQIRTFLGKIVEQAERLGALIVDVIRLGKIESQPEAFDVKPVAVRPVMEASLEAHAAVASAGGISLQGQPVGKDVFVLADDVELRTILDNLVDNALHYTPSGGTVSVRVLDTDAQRDRLGIEVADSGIGLAQDQQARIFERFYRVDRARDRRRGGTGLGLAIVKHLSQIMGGRVDVDSELGVGSRFTVWLPVPTSAGEVTEKVALREAAVDLTAEPDDAS